MRHIEEVRAMSTVPLWGMTGQRVRWSRLRCLVQQRSARCDSPLIWSHVLCLLWECISVGIVNPMEIPIASPSFQPNIMELPGQPYHISTTVYVIVKVFSPHNSNQSHSASCTSRIWGWEDISRKKNSMKIFVRFVFQCVLQKGTVALTPERLSFLIQ